MAKIIKVSVTSSYNFGFMSLFTLSAFTPKNTYTNNFYTYKHLCHDHLHLNVSRVTGMLMVHSKCLHHSLQKFSPSMGSNLTSYQHYQLLICYCRTKVKNLIHVWLIKWKSWNSSSSLLVFNWLRKCPNKCI